MDLPAGLGSIKRSCERDVHQDKIGKRGGTGLPEDPLA